MSPALLALALGTASVPALADDGVILTPDVVEAPADRPFADLSVRNAAGAPREIHVALYAWTQDDAGRVLLTSASDAAMFPARALIAPGESRRFRLSTAAADPVRERAYRIAVSVLDPADGAAQVGAPAVIALVPAFVAPVRRRIGLQISVSCDRVPGCRVVLANVGTVRVRPAQISVSGAGDRAGATALEPWWVLAGGVRVYALAEPSSPHDRIVVRVRVDDREFVARSEPEG